MSHQHGEFAPARRNPRSRLVGLAVATVVSGFAASAMTFATPVNAAPQAQLTSSDRTMGAQSSANPFTGQYVGYCTYGAQELVKQNAGYYIRALTGSAADWDDAARPTWIVTDDAQPRSLVVWERGIQGADPNYGHVAWVDNVTTRNGQSFIDVTEMNYAGGFGVFSSRKNVPNVPGMSYILIP